MGTNRSTNSTCLLGCALLLLGGCGDQGTGSIPGGPASNGAAGSPLQLQRISQTEGGFSGELDDHDEFGTAVAGIGDLDGDGIGDLAVGAPWDEDGDTQVARGAVWILFMNPDLTVRDQARIAPAPAETPEPLDDGGLFGAALAGPGDLDGDGIPDLTVGAPRNGNNRQELPERKGSVWNLLLRRDGTVREWKAIEPDELDGPRIRDGLASFGASLAALGDVDGDGVRDIAIAAQTNWRATAGQKRDGISIAFLHGSGSLKAMVPLSALTPGRYEIAAAGDLDGNGVVDLVASPGSPSILHLDADGTSREAVTMEVPRCEIAESCRYYVNDLFAVVRDLDGDGRPELASVGHFDLAPGSGDEGRRALFLWSFDADGQMRLLRRFTSEEGAFEGRRVSALGDLDGDGRPEIAIMLPRASDGGAARGAFWLGTLSDVPATTTSSTLDSTTTSSSTSTTCIPDVCDADDQGATFWDIEVHLDESRTVSALQFEVHYSDAPGFFLGSNRDVECSINPDLAAFPAFSDKDGVVAPTTRRSLGVAIITIAGFAGPQRLVSCRFQSNRGEPSPDDFVLELIDATQPNLRGANASLHVEVRPAP